jgi:membrane-bound lytic murein transglycosylase D
MRYLLLLGLLTHFAFAQSQDVCQLEEPIQLKILDDNKSLIVEEKQEDNSSKQSIQPHIDKDVEYFVNRFKNTEKNILNALKKTDLLASIKQIFKKEGIPEELAYLAVIESGLNPTIKSPSNAVGIWQLMPQTARNFGLKVNKYIDERKDPYKSTIAAAKYLKSLYNTFGSWELAIASYNCGGGCIMKRIKSASTSSFSEIKHLLPKQTKKYVSKFFAVLLIASECDT